MESDPKVSDFATRRTAEPSRSRKPCRETEGSPASPCTARAADRKGTLPCSTILRALRGTFDAIVMITDPQRVRETLGSWERDSGMRQVTHD